MIVGGGCEEIDIRQSADFPAAPPPPGHHSGPPLAVIEHVKQNIMLWHHTGYVAMNAYAVFMGRQYLRCNVTDVFSSVLCVRYCK